METLIRNTEARSLYWKPGSNDYSERKANRACTQNKHSVKKRGKERHSGLEGVGVDTAI